MFLSLRGRALVLCAKVGLTLVRLNLVLVVLALLGNFLVKSALAVLHAMQGNIRSTKRVVLTVKADLMPLKLFLRHACYVAPVHIPISRKERQLVHLAMLGHFRVDNRPIVPYALWGNSADLERQHALSALQARLRKNLARQLVLRARLADTVLLNLNFAKSALRGSPVLPARRRVHLVQLDLLLQKMVLHPALHVLLVRTH